MRMRLGARIPAAALLLVLPVCWAQSAPATHHAKKPAKPEPTQQELFDYVRGELLALSPSDGINDNTEVSFYLATSVLTITQPDGRCDIFLGAMDSNSAIWEVFDPSDTYHTREQVLRLTLTSLSGKKARVCYDRSNQVDTSIASNRARLLFSFTMSNALPKFTDNMGKAVKKLIALAGGTPEKDLF